MHFNENTRVKIPAILHLCRLGYRYLSLKSAQWDESTNIFTDIFNESIRRLNPEFDEKDTQCVYDEIAICLENEDLGRAFYEKLINRSGTKQISAGIRCMWLPNCPAERMMKSFVPILPC